jgi:hypothetical protein
VGGAQEEEEGVEAVAEDQEEQQRHLSLRRRIDDSGLVSLQTRSPIDAQAAAFQEMEQAQVMGFGAAASSPLVAPAASEQATPAVPTGLFINQSSSSLANSNPLAAPSAPAAAAGSSASAPAPVFQFGAAASNPLSNPLLAQSFAASKPLQKYKVGDFVLYKSKCAQVACYWSLDGSYEISYLSKLGNQLQRNVPQSDLSSLPSHALSSDSSGAAPSFGGSSIGGAAAPASNFAAPSTGFGFDSAVGATQSAPHADAGSPGVGGEAQSILRKPVKYPPPLPPTSTLLSILTIFAGLSRSSSKPKRRWWSSRPT